MKKRTVARIQVEKEKRDRKRARRRPSRQAKDPKDQRGAKGALLKQPADAALEGESLRPGPVGSWYVPIGAGSDW